MDEGFILWPHLTWITSLKVWCPVKSCEKLGLQHMNFVRVQFSLQNYHSLNFFFSDVDHFQSLYWICYNIVSIFVQYWIFDFVQFCYNICYNMFWFFGIRACGMLVPWPWIKLAPPALNCQGSPSIILRDESLLDFQPPSFFITNFLKC